MRLTDITQSKSHIVVMVTIKILWQIGESAYREYIYFKKCGLAFLLTPPSKFHVIDWKTSYFINIHQGRYVMNGNKMQKI